MLRALTDGNGNAYYSGGKMLVVQTTEPEPDTVIAAGNQYVPLNAFITRTIVRKTR
jgi:hypothetical protein